MNKIILLLSFFITGQSVAQVLPVWYNDHKTDISTKDFSKLKNEHSGFSLIRVIDTFTIPESVSIIVLNEDGNFLRELDLNVAAYCNSKDNIIAGKRINGRLLMGVTDLKGKPVIPLEYLKIRYAKNLFAIKNQESLWALYNSKGNKITDFIYLDMLFTSYGKVKVKNKTGVGVINEDGTIFIETIYGDIDQVAADSFLLKDPDIWMCLDAQKNIKFKWQADSLKPLNDSLLLFYAEGKVFIKDSLGKIIGSPTGYEEIGKVNNTYLEISSGEYSGLIDFNGKEILPVKYCDFQFACWMFCKRRLSCGC